MAEEVATCRFADVGRPFAWHLQSRKGRRRHRQAPQLREGCSNFTITEPLQCAELSKAVGDTKQLLERRSTHVSLLAIVQIGVRVSIVGFSVESEICCRADGARSTHRTARMND